MPATSPASLSGRISAWVCALSVLAALLAPAPAGAQHDHAHAPQLILVLADALTLADVTDGGQKALATLAQQGALGLMNCAVAGKKDGLAAMLTLAVGQRVPAEPTDAQAANDGEAVPGERGNAGEVYRRRAGAGHPPGENSGDARNVKHLGMASLARRGLDTARLGAALAGANPPIAAAVFGNADTEARDRSAALLTVDASGRGAGRVAPLRFLPKSPFGIADDPLLLAKLALESEADFAVVHLGDLARAEAARSRLSPADYRRFRADALRRLDLFLGYLKMRLDAQHSETDVLLISPRPPQEWDRLTPVLAFGPRFPPGLLTSGTTRTVGLISNVDIAPTILRLFAVPGPLAMIGRVVRSAPAGESGARRVAEIARREYVAWLNGWALLRAMPPIGALCAALVLLGLAVRRRENARGARILSSSLIFTLALPAALLFAPLLPPPTLMEYGLRIVAWMAGLTAFCLLLARLLRLPPTVILAGLTLLPLAGDILAGQPLLKDSLLSGYPLSGIRFYGIGNEYLGAALGMALAGGFAWMDAGETRGKRGAIVIFWTALLLLFGWPGLGANAGSLAATGAGFGVGTALLFGRRPTLALGIACILAGLLLAVGFSLLEARLAAGGDGTGSVSHAGAAIQAAAGGRGAGYLAEIALRKLAMNFRLFLTPWFLLGAGVVAGTVALVRAAMGAQLRETLRRNPWQARGLNAVFAAGIAALLFKDSGVVTVAFLAGVTFLFLLYPLLAPPEKASGD